MGQRHTNLILNRSATLNLPYSDYDKLIFIQYEYIKSNISKDILEKQFPFLNVNELEQLKRNDEKRKKFILWFKMWYKNDEIKQINKINISTITPLLSSKGAVARQKDNTILSKFTLKTNSFSESKILQKPTVSVQESVAEETNNISQCELSLRLYYSKNQKIFCENLLNGPPETFRWVSWLICSHVPEKRFSYFYSNLIKFPLSQDIQQQINKDIMRTMQENEISINELYEPLFRILKAMALIDKEMSYCQGMNFICGFMLLASEGNEIDSFFLLLSLFSETFINNKFGIRGFFIDTFPLLAQYIFVFKYFLKKKLKKIFDFFEDIELPPQCWISKWFQTLFVHILPYDAVIRVWDGVFAYGIKFLISVALSLLAHFENEILAKEDIIEVTEFFKLLNPTHYKIPIEKMSKYNIENILHFAVKDFFVSDEEFETIKELYYSSEKEAIILEKKIYDYQNLIPHLDNDNSFDDFEEVNQFLKATKGDEDGVKKSNIKMSVVVNEDIDSMR